MSAINRKFFFDQVSLRLFDGRLTAKTRRSLNQILDYWEKNHSKDDDRWLAYALGTAIMKPPRIWERQGKEIYPYYGRGLVSHLGTQLQENEPSRRRRLGQISGPRLDLTNAIPIMFVGMKQGMFTGKKFADFFNNSKEDWVNARKIINPASTRHN